MIISIRYNCNRNDDDMMRVIDMINMHQTETKKYSILSVNNNIIIG